MSEKQHIIDTAKTMVRENGLINLSREALCKRAGVPDGSFYAVMGGSFTDFVSTLEDHGKHKVLKARVAPALRKEALLSAAIVVAKDVGYNRIGREAIANEAGVSVSLTNHYFGNMNQLKTAVMRYAVTNEVLEVIAQGIALGDSQAKKAPEEVKARAIKLLEVA